VETHLHYRRVSCQRSRLVENSELTPRPSVNDGGVMPKHGPKGKPHGNLPKPKKAAQAKKKK